MANIHWFPGHMNKALHNVEDKIKLVDVVIELLDARAPESSINENLEKVIKNKQKLVILTKPDLADPSITNKWANALKNHFDEVLVLELTEKSSEAQISNAISRLGTKKWEKEKAKGMKPQPIRTMIVGIPNVGKSSLINRLAKRKAAGVQNKPGYTRGEQWIKVNNNFLLLDTPGILPMSYENQQKAANLALIGSIREDILPNTDLVNILLSFLKKHYPNALENRFNIKEISDYETMMKQICSVRGLKDSRGNDDYTRAEILLLKEFKDGLLGHISLEII